LEILIGCTGWSYEPWLGSFYPKNLPSSSFLKFYSSIFDITEINSTYYRIPNKFMTKKWFADTPDNFRFTAKFPKKITHDQRLKDVEKTVDEFLDSMEPLKTKISALILQLPPSLSFEEAKPRLENLIENLPNYYKYPIEGRHESWFTEDALNFLTKKNLCLVWNEIEGVTNPAPLTSDFIYLRLIGDRSIPEEHFGKIVRSKKSEIKKWAHRLDEVKNKVSVVFALANNHLEGFAPSSANTLRTAMGLEELSWHDTRQKTLTDFDGKKLHDLYRHSTKLIK